MPTQHDLTVEDDHDCIVLGHHDEGVLWPFHKPNLIYVLSDQLLLRDAPKEWKFVQVFGKELEPLLLRQVHVRSSNLSQVFRHTLIIEELLIKQSHLLLEVVDVLLRDDPRFLKRD